MKKMKSAARFAVLLSAILWLSGDGEAMNGINTTKHNLSVSGPGEIKARGETGETRICIFCHTPHNAAPSTPLWNRAIPAKNYELYKSSTLIAKPSQPLGPSRLCLSCHDGTIGLGSTLRPSGGIMVTREITPERPSFIGSLVAEHPISFSFTEEVSNPEIRMPTKALTLYGTGYVECSTCHNAHDDTYGRFLVMDNRGSALCLQCHMMNGWPDSSHKNSLKTLPSPLPGMDWTGWTTVADYGCEGCHKPHGAGGPEWLLRFQREEDNCYSCHNGTVASKTISAQFQKTSRHPVELTTGVHMPKESPLLILARHVECTDCHNAHSVNATAAPLPTDGRVSGKTRDVSGMTMSRNAALPAQYEYEICFKCHADMTPHIPFIPRVVNNTNLQSAFDLSNPSFHPVEGVGRNRNVPSLPSPFEPALTTVSIILCTDCHADDDGLSRGPHGSRYAPILRERYETMDNSMESYQTYALCYRCHNRTSILSDVSFQKKIAKTTATGGGHSGHLANGASCSACHDPHGINTTSSQALGTGDHTTLINFDTRTVSPKAAGGFPTFTRKGTFSGSCTLVCHGRTHSDATYP